MSLFEQLTPISEDYIQEQQLTEDNVWFVYYEGEEFGPFDTAALLEFSNSRQEVFANVKVRNNPAHEWKDFFAHSKFQRREPKLIPAQSLVSSDEFFVLVEGIKEGPYNLEQLQHQIDSKVVRLSDQISVDDGKTWIKIYEHHAFDRRNRAPTDLPSNTDALIAVQKMQIDENLGVEREEENLVAGLGFISKNAGDTKDVPQQKKIKEPPKEIPKGTPKKTKSKAKAKVKKMPAKKLNKKLPWHKFIGAAVVVFAIVAFGDMLGLFGEAPKNTPNRQKSVHQRQINNSDRSVNLKRAPAKATERSPIRRQKTKPRKKAITSRLKNRKRRRKEPKDFEALDIDDPKVREELYREFASEEDYEQYDDDYEEPTPREPVEEGYNDDYPENDSPEMVNPDAGEFMEEPTNGEEPFQEGNGMEREDELEDEYMEVETFD
jgi:hypothetical protein